MTWDFPTFSSGNLYNLELLDLRKVIYNKGIHTYSCKLSSKITFRRGRGHARNTEYNCVVIAFLLDVRSIIYNLKFSQSQYRKSTKK